MAIIAEDLGVITTDVNDLRKDIGAPGMVVLQFAWGSGATNTHIPHNHYENSVCYPGMLCTLRCCNMLCTDNTNAVLSIVACLKFPPSFLPTSCLTYLLLLFCFSTCDDVNLYLADVQTAW